jgi:hypothetical protein
MRQREGDSRRHRLRVGIVGHRHNRLRAEDVPALIARVGQILERVDAVARGQRGATKGQQDNVLSVTSALADGADRIGARAALARGCALECPLPFQRDEYEKDFDGPQSRNEFREMLEAAETVWELAGSRRDAAGAYAAVGAAVLDHSDLLLAIWDGKDARGRGGTAEIVRAAADRMPVVWIHPDPTVEVRLLAVGEDGEPKTHPVSELEQAIASALVALAGHGNAGRR